MAARRLEDSGGGGIDGRDFFVVRSSGLKMGLNGRSINVSLVLSSSSSVEWCVEWSVVSVVSVWVEGWVGGAGFCRVLGGRLYRELNE